MALKSNGEPVLRSCHPERSEGPTVRVARRKRNM
jgi:hypothetical protein